MANKLHRETLSAHPRESIRLSFTDCRVLSREGSIPRPATCYTC
uniref:Uncharacterized protein n=1 Tax=Anguilla anguilla TaxID=7936 RepID=A0A0E9QQ80_ANGAN